MKFERIVLVLFVTVCTAIMFLNEYADSGFEEYGATQVVIHLVDSHGNQRGTIPEGDDVMLKNIHGHWTDHSEEWHSGSCFGSSLLHTDHDFDYIIEGHDVETVIILNLAD